MSSRLSGVGTSGPLGVGIAVGWCVRSGRDRAASRHGMPVACRSFMPDSRRSARRRLSGCFTQLAFAEGRAGGAMRVSKRSGGGYSIGGPSTSDRWFDSPRARATRKERQ